MSTPRPSRADRRRATEARILGSARELFAEKGFDRTTIRAVAGAAGVDPALVMQYFGSKRELFTQALQQVFPTPAADGGEADTGTHAGPAEAGAGTDAVVDQLLSTLGLKLGRLPEGTLAMMRSMLTDPATADDVRAALDRQIAGFGEVLPPGEDAELRAALAVTALLGITIGHQLLGLSSLRDVPADRIAALLRPAFNALAAPSD